MPVLVPILEMKELLFNVQYIRYIGTKNHVTTNLDIGDKKKSLRFI